VPIPRNDISNTPEGLATYEQIISQDETYFPEGNIPLIYKPTQTRDKSAYWHEDLFQVLNQQIEQIDPELPRYNYQEDVVQDLKKNYVPFNKYRAILSEKSTNIPIFSRLTPTHQKRIVDQEALDMSALHNYVISKMPKDMEDDDKRRLMKTYNGYFNQNVLPQTIDRMRRYSARESVDASNDNIKQNFLTTIQGLLEGAGSTIERKGILGVSTETEKALNTTFEGWAENVKGWIGDLEQGTGIYSMSDEEIAKDIGEHNLLFMTAPTFKSGYLFNKVAEGFAQQVVTSGLPWAGGVMGGAIGTSVGGPVGGVIGFGIGAVTSVIPGFLVESGSFEDEMSDNWESLREHAKQAKEGNWYSDEKFKEMFTVPLDEDGNLNITADKLTDKTIKDITENLSQLYALKATGYELAGTALTVLGGKAFTALHGQAIKTHFMSKMGQRAAANRFFQAVKKPLAIPSKLIFDVSQEAYVEGEQEDINISMMEPYMANYNKMSEEEKDRRIKSARFQGGVIGAVFSGGQMYVENRMKNRAIDTENRAIQIEDQANYKDITIIDEQIKESKKKGNLWINDDDLAVQIAMSIDPTMSEFRDIVRDNSEDPAGVDNLIVSRTKNNYQIQHGKALGKLLLKNKTKAKKIMKQLGLTAAHFATTGLSTKDFTSLFGKKLADTLLDKQTMDNLTDETTNEDFGDYTQENPNDVYDDQELNHGEQVVDEEMSKLVKQFNNLSNAISRLKKQKKKPSPAQEKKLKQLQSQISALKKSGKKKTAIKNNQQNVNTITGELNESDPTSITTLNLDNIVGKSKSKMSFIKDKKDGQRIDLKIISKSTETNPKTGKKETVYVVEPSVGKEAASQGSKPSDSSQFKLFQSEIDIAITKVGNNPPKRWKAPIPQEEKTNYLNEQITDEKKSETKEKGMTFSSFDQPIEVGDLKNTTTATISDLAYIRPNFETILKAFKKSKKKTMKAFMSLAPRLIENYRLIKSESGDILILEDGKAIGEIKADETEKGLRTESLILGKGKNAIIVNNVVSVNNADTQVAKYNIPPIKSEKTTQNLSKPKVKPTKTTKSGVTLYKKLYSNLSNQFDAFANLIKQTMNVVGLSKGERLWNKYASWYGDVDYTYSGKTHKMQEMPSEIQAIARNIEQQLGLEEGYFNSALANVFPKGQQLGEHADDEKIFVRDNKTIGKVATVSLGGSTKIIIRNIKTNKKESILVQDGDLYVMPGQTFQIEHKHSVTPTQGERVSITFRHIPESRLPAKKETKLTLNELIETGSASDVFIEIAKSGNAIFRGIATFVAENIGNVNIRFDKRIKVQGKWNGKEIIINPNNIDSREALEQTLLHEAIHATTSNLINKYLKGTLSKKSSVYQSIKALDDIFNEIKDGLSSTEKDKVSTLQKFIEQYKSGKLSKSDMDLAVELREEFYGLENLKEFVAELMTNEVFQEKLKKIKYKGENKTLYQKFKELIASVFGVKAGNNALYNGLINAIDVVQYKGEVVKKAPPITPVSKKDMGNVTLKDEQEFDDWFNDGDDTNLDDGSLLVDETIVGQNIVDNLTNVDPLSDPNVPEEDNSFLIKWGKNKGVLNRKSKKRAYRAFEKGFVDIIRKHGLPLSYFTEYRRSMNEKLENIDYIKKYFNKWADDYQVTLEEYPDRLFSFDVPDDESFNAMVKNDKAFSDYAETFQSALDMTEEHVRQGIGIDNEGKLEADTKAENFNQIDTGFFKAIGLSPTVEQMTVIWELLNNTDLEGFIKGMSDSKFIRENKLFLEKGKTLSELLDTDINGRINKVLTRFWVSNLRDNRTPSNRGINQKDSIQSLYAIYRAPKKDEDGNIIEPGYFTFKPKDQSVIEKIRGKIQLLYKNLPNKLRSRAVESLFGDGELRYISLKDLWRWQVEDSAEEGKNKSYHLVKDIKNLNSELLRNFIRSSLKTGMVPILVRGDTDLIPMVRITKEHNDFASDRNVRTYWKRELDLVPDDLKTDVKRNWIMKYIAQSTTDDVQWFTGLNNILYARRKYNAAMIARHEAYKKIYGDDYWIHLTSHNMLHRAKLPFGVGNSNPLMPNKRIIVLNPRISDVGEVKEGKISKSRAVIRKIYHGGTVNEIPLVQEIDGQLQYIWDGMTLTSEKVHAQDYPEYFGTNDKARRAKTFFYERGEIGALINKHQEMSPYLEDGVEKLEITNGFGDVVATISKDSDGYVNIKDAEGNYVDYLSSPDETKIMTGEYANKYDQPIEIDGKSIRLIMYPRDNDKSYGKFFKQLMNYFPDSRMQNLVREFFDDADPRKKFSPRSLFKLFVEIATNPKKMDEFKRTYSSATIDGLPLAMARNAELGVGFHPTDSGTNANVVKNAILQEISEFKTYGSKLDFRMDMMGHLEDNEIVLPSDHKIVQNIKNITGLRTRDEINTWLLNNDLEVLAIRSPVPSRFGYRVLKIKSIEPIGDTFMVNPKIVKQVFEGDGDGDTATIVFLNNKQKELLKELKDRQELTGGLALSASDQNIDISTLEGLAEGISIMQNGKRAISQVANIAKNVGIMSTWFKEMIVNDGERKIKMRKLTDVVEDSDMGESHSIENLLRMYLQAGADHAKLLLLGPDQWNYSVEKLYSMVFYYEDAPNELISEEHYKIIRKEILRPMTRAGSVLRGHDMDSQLRFADYLERSEEYLDFIENRNEIIEESEGAIIKGKTSINHVLEHIIVSFAKEAYANGIDGDQFTTPFGTSKYIHSTTVKKHAEKWTKETMDIAFEEEGYDLKNMTNEEKDQARRVIMPKIQTAIKLAQNFSTQLHFAIKKRRVEEMLDDDENARAFSSNTFMFDPRAAEVLERFLGIMDDFDYTNYMKRAFTASFLNDTVDISKRGASAVKSKLVIPPTDPVDPRNALLDKDIMKEYYGDYNALRSDLDGVIKTEAPSLLKTIEYVKDEFEKKGCMI